MAIWTRYSGAMSTNNNRINYRVKVVLNSQNIANNTSNVTVSVEVWRNNTGYTTKGTGTAYLTIDGTNYSDSIVSTQLFTHNSYTQVVSRTVNITHGSDGAKNLGVSARIAHSQFSSNNQSYSTSLNTIPRASTLSAFSFGSQLQPSTAVTINYTVSRKSDNFRHQIKLLDGSHEVQVWDNISSNGASALTLSTASVNSLLNRMSSVTSRTLTLRVATRSGNNGGWIGSAVTRNANINIHSNVKPTISGLSISQTGNSVSSHTLQGISKITASFTRSGGYGASISNNTITVRRKGNNDDVQTINSNDGTTGRVVTHSGTYQAQGMVRDSRGRTAYTAWTDIPVTVYSPPRITTFTATRNASTQTTINIVRNTTHTNLGTSNPLTFSVQRRLGTGSWTNVNTNPSGSYNTSPLTNGGSTSTGNSVTASYDFKLTVTDKFNNKAESIITVSTQRVVLDVHKNEGVGIGKIRERGELDVDGSAYFSGSVNLSPSGTSSTPYFKLNSNDTNGHGYVEWFGSNQDRVAFMGVSNATAKNFRISTTHGDGIEFTTPYNNLTVNGTHIAQSGVTNSGHWTRFYDGTQICVIYYNQTITTATDGIAHYSLSGTFTYPVAFNEPPSVFGLGLGGEFLIGTPYTMTNTTIRMKQWVAKSISNRNFNFRIVAIGRWR